jgi:DNA polymerase III subunit epsilon
MKYLIFDTETTGLPRDRNGSVDDSSNWPYVVQVAWMTYDDETNRHTKSSDIIRVSESVVISKESIAVHGIDRARCVREGVPIETVIRKFQRALRGADVVIAHNLDFDKPLIMAECGRHSIPHGFCNSKEYYCTMKNGIKLCKLESTNPRTGRTYYRYPKLDALHEKLFGSVPRGTHDALVDVLVCFRCYCKMVRGVDIAAKNRQIGGLIAGLCGVSWTE